MEMQAQTFRSVRLEETDNVSELWRRIQINGQVNTYTPGTYTCSYYVVDSAGNMSNTAELTVIVQ